MVALDTLRRLLEAADVRRDPYAVAEASASLLERDGRDVPAAWHYLRALAALELGDAARRVRVLLGPPAAENQAAEAMLDRLPARLIPWSSRRRRWQANLRALQQRGIPADSILAAWDDPAANNARRYELHQSSDGNFHILDTAAAGQAPWKSWLTGLQNHLAAIATITHDTFKGQIRGPLAFDGMGHGWLIPHVLRASENSYLNYSAAMYVAEPDLVAVAMVLHMHDLQEWIAGPRLRLFLGDGAGERLLQALRDNAAWTLPTSFVVNPLCTRPSLDLQKQIEALAARRDEERRLTLERIAAHYAAFDAAAWRRRFAEAAIGKGPALRVLGITTRYSTVLRYSMEELQAAAGGGGAEGVNLRMDICMEPDDQSLEKDYVGMIDRLKPDLLVTISRMRYETPDLPRNIPALCWDQDNLQCMRDPGALADLRELTFVAGHGAVFGSMHLKWPPQACIFCHPAGMTHRYQPGAASAQETERFGGDVSYVSHASGMPEQLRTSLRAKWTGGAGDFLRLFDASSEQVIDATRRGQSWEFSELLALIRRIAVETKTPPLPAAEHALMADLRLLVDRVFRHETLGWVARWCESRGKRLRLWGNGWDSHPTLAKWAAGAALPGEQAQAVYRASRMNLQIIETGVLHSRLLDGWAAGGFFLIRQAHRSQDEAQIQNQYRIGQLVESETIETIGELEQRGSAELRNLWNTHATYYAEFGRARVFPGFRMWRSLVPAHVLIPELKRVMFNDAGGFEKLADEYASSEVSRIRVAAGIREVLLRHLSYDARWRDFIRHMTANVGYAGT